VKIGHDSVKLKNLYCQKPMLGTTGEDSRLEKA
jgi:hypothetical protein